MTHSPPYDPPPTEETSDAARMGARARARVTPYDREWARRQWWLWYGIPSLLGSAAMGALFLAWWWITR